ncbi:BRO family protein [Clostridium kluyveri]|uniref:BRO family protein n=1 Tax=Clostridium kluyveri TaxID=1534 RepID=UPI0022486FB4|nr:BRO family protein [Clostridium kluyveri]UZQ51624.1 BRO family protein [Clostridium kluyveri]
MRKINNLELIKSKNFNSTLCNFYQNNEKEIFMTREQIGTALEYSNPADAIRKIHDRHKERLDKFSVQDKLTGTDGKLYMNYLYNMKGVYEIYRWSRQPKADEFIDFVWNVIEEIRKGNFKVEPIQLQLMRETNRTLKFIQNNALKSNIAKQVLSKIYDIEITPADINSFVDENVKDFITSNCESVADSKIKIRDLYNSYKKWCNVNSIRPFSIVKFGRQLVLLGFEKVHIHTGRYWSGIKVKELK